MRKIFILLFPQKEYLFNDQSTDLFNDCIKKRYIDNGYQFYVIKFDRSDLGFVTIRPNKVFDADITYKKSSAEYCVNWRNPNLRYTARNIGLTNEDSLVIGGFRCNDNVQRLAEEIYLFNKNVIVDTDLTEQFWSTAKHQRGWKIEKYNPDLKLKTLVKNIPPPLLKRMYNKYSNPIWGVSKKILDNLKVVK